MFETLFIVIISAYFIQAIIITIGVKRKFDKISEDKLQNATVIVAARNEEKNIKECLVSLSQLKYPENKLEIIIVDDFSNDNTEAIIKEFILDKPIF